MLFAKVKTGFGSIHDGEQFPATFLRLRASPVCC